MDMDSAIQKLVPGGTIYALPGVYSKIHIGMKNSGNGLEDGGGRKSLIALGEATVRTGKADYRFVLDADYWNITGFNIDGEEVVDSRGFYIYGSHNHISKCKIYDTKSDAGLCIASSSRSASRTLWPSYNLIEDCESYHHVDASGINADGFAAKNRAGDNNKFVRCVSHDNADDGWDLFNKLAEGKNGTTIIEDCIAYNNGNNGFKLGGESLPVQHQIRGSIAFNNGLDGFTDNFNPGELIVENNTSFNNARFNFIFRPSPYLLDEDGNITAAGSKINNVSYRTEITDGTYNDKVYGREVENNFFIEEAGQAHSAEHFLSLDPADAYYFQDGKLVLGDFLRLRVDSPGALAGAGASSENNR